MIKLLLTRIWAVVDVLCFLAAIGLFVWAFFTINLTAGLFGSGFGLLAIGFLTEQIAGGKEVK